MYIVTLVMDYDQENATFWYADICDALVMVGELADQGFVAKIEKVA